MSVLLCRCKFRSTRITNCTWKPLNKFSSARETPPELTAAYVPGEVEQYPLRDDFFKPPLTTPAERFTVILPPPNVTGTLHLGHALTATIQDVLVKWHRMSGKETVWVPGTDHAGIATQVIVEKKLWRERGQTRHQMGREEFVNEVWKWKHEKSDVIGAQLRRLGLSLDWKREMFTMDEKQSTAVVAAFISLHEAGLLYEADGLVNWSCILRSAISDIEVDHLSLQGPTRLPVPGYENPVEFGVLTKFAYKFEDAADELVVATTRPETMLGDVAVAVHPNDGRYSAYVGRKLWHPFRNEAIPIVADEFVDPNFGTGAVKVTPAHDPTDFAVAKLFSLPSLAVISEEGNILSTCKDFDGQKRFDARVQVTIALEQLGLLRGRQDHAMVVPICSRSKDILEFLVKPQWFLKCDEMARQAVEDVKAGRLKIDPPQFEKVWFNWLENIRDWCVSRQLWWGHRIPVYVCTNLANQTLKVVARDAGEAFRKAQEHSGEGNVSAVKQVDDVLDTWFSSALLPFTAFGWPSKNEDYAKNYPLTLMETGHDIVFFWVARMAMLGTQLTGQLPFSKILLHGVVCDAKGRKMSKSRGNVIAPEDVISGRSLKELEASSKCSLQSGLLTDEEFRNAVLGQRKMFPEGIHECGVDALRFTLCSHNIKNHYINFDVQECRTNKLFGNKLWQATKFSVKWCQTVSQSQMLLEKSPSRLREMDKWILGRLSRAVDVVNGSLGSADFHNAAAALKSFLYYDFCDVYLETTKRGLKSVESEEAAAHCWVLVTCLDVGLRCLAPFMPHLCQHLHRQLLVHPKVKDGPAHFPTEFHNVDVQLEREVERLLGVVTGIRRLKKMFNLTAKHRREALLITRDVALKAHEDTMRDLSGCEAVEVVVSGDEVGLAFAGEYVRDTIADDVIVYLHVPEVLRKAFEVDAEKLDRKRTKLSAELEKIQRVISADGYRVTADVHEINLKKVVSLEEKIARIDYVRSFASR